MAACRGAARGVSSLSLKTEYRSGEDNLVTDFYAPCLRAASIYQRAVGYFRSSVFLLAGEELIEFARCGGHMQLVCSPDLRGEDVEAMQNGYSDREKILAKRMTEEFESLLDSARTRERTIALATMIAVGAMDVKLALRPDGYGLFHEKLGIFADGDDEAEVPAVSFRGSSNETWNGWHDLGNHESFEVFRSWADRGEAARVRRHRAYFSSLWKGNVLNVETRALPELAAGILLASARDGLDALGATRVRATGRSALRHQLQALENWVALGRSGILKHATGSGKTYTALLALRDHVRHDGAALIVVPSDLLLEQWAAEIRRELPAAALLVAGGGQDIWRKPDRLESFTACPEPGLGPRVVLVTIQTASKPEFWRRVAGGPHLLMVCDEVHRAGSPEYSQVLNIVAGARLGLSATPERYGDPEGTSKLFSYFGTIVPPSFTLQDAIQAGRLVQYEYHPNVVHLTDEELALWEMLTRRISLESSQLDENNGIHTIPEALRLLLIRRARIAKKAAGKLNVATQVLKEHFRNGQSWLVYCEDADQLRDVRAAIERLTIPVNEYFTGMRGSRGETLDWFRRFGGVLVSIRCLDEGVDIPEVSHALILASSQNPREFIQRRGRVLRVAPGKQLAIVHDALVLPNAFAETNQTLSIAVSELRRALEFASSAINRTAEADLYQQAIALGIDVSKFSDFGLEDHEQQDNSD